MPDTSAGGDREPAVRIRGLTKTYPRPAPWRRPFSRPPGIRALDAFDLDLHAGEVMGLLGPNGAGKTTLIKVLADLVGPDRGEVRICGLDHRTAARRIRGLVGWVHCDERSFLWRLSGRENLLFFAALHEIPRAVALDRIERLAERFGVASRLRDRFVTYSAGTRKLFAVLRGLLNEPRIVLMDEPTNSLDPIAARTLKAHVVHEVAGRNGATVLWATHRLEEVPEVCRRVTLLHQGRRLFCDSVEAFRSALPAAANPEPATRPTLEDVFEDLVR